MSGKILDANIVIDLFREDQKTVEKLKNIRLVYIPVIVLGELFYGANLSNRVKERLSQIEQFSSRVKLLDCDKYTASYYGKIKAQLKRDGTPIPENDIWIAAIGMQHKLTILTNDKHFLQVKELQVDML